ncbi:MAG: ABC transporter substrate-binding protein [Lutispora sp.]|jgi:peptide/nickel transport system substrate-binding protein|uniref:ABC transporter substrate-binding protein n=1 Tax=Lutispora sp. TaxID=2828727 RepID=UPI003568094F
MRKKLLLVISTILILSLIFSACAKEPTENADNLGAEQHEEKPKVEQVLKYGTDAEPSGLDPHTISATAAIRIFGQIYNALIDVDDDMNFIPELAESWEQPNDVTYIFKLRKGVKFHNGREMVADDVKYSFERVLDPATAAIGQSYYNMIESIEVLGDYEVKFTLKEPFAPFLTNLTSLYGAIVPKEVVEENGNLMQVACGTGPFKLKEWIPDNRIVLVKNEDYFEEGKPTLDAIEYYVMTDEASRIAALRTGNVHLVKLPAASKPLVEGNEDIVIKSYQSNDYTYLGFNLTLDKFKDPRVRQAISYAINRQEIIDMTYDGEAEVSGFVPSAMGRWAIDYASEDLYKQNIEKAKQLMAEAGYPNGFETTIAVGLLDDIRSTGEIIQKQLEAIGIKAEIQNLETGQYIDAWSNKKHEMMAGRNGAGSDPNRAVAFFFSTEGSANVWGYSNPDVDKLCDLGKKTVDEDEREKIYKEAQKLILNDCPNLFIASPMEYYFVRKEVKNFNPWTFNAEDFKEIIIE